MDNIPAEELEQRFGFTLRRLTPDEKARADEISTLFDSVRNETGLRSLEVFRRAGREADHRRFLSAVTSCPEEVLTLARRLIAPDSPERQKH